MVAVEPVPATLIGGRLAAFFTAPFASEAILPYRKCVYMCAATCDKGVRRRCHNGMQTNVTWQKYEWVEDMSTI